MANEQERSLLQQLINGQIDKDTYEREVAKIRTAVAVEEASQSPFKYTVAGQGYLTLEAIEQEQRDKLKESIENTGNIDIAVARAAQNTAQAKIDYMLSDEYQKDIEEDRLNKLKLEAENTEGMLDVNRSKAINNTANLLKSEVSKAQKAIEERQETTTPTTTTTTESANIEETETEETETEETETEETET